MEYLLIANGLSILTKGVSWCVNKTLKNYAAFAWQHSRS